MLSSSYTFILCSIIVIFSSIKFSSQLADAYPAQELCANYVKWKAGDPYGAMGIRTYTAGTEDGGGCVISVLSNSSDTSSAITAATGTYTPCKIYTIVISTMNTPVGHKLVVDNGLLDYHPEYVKTREDSPSCRSAYTQTLSKYTFAAPSNGKPVNIYALCGRDSTRSYIAKMYVAAITLNSDQTKVNLPGGVCAHEIKDEEVSSCSSAASAISCK